MRKSLLIPAVSLVCFLTSIDQAKACSSGLIASVLCETGIISEKTAKDLDAGHAKLGNPLDKMVGQKSSQENQRTAPERTAKSIHDRPSDPNLTHMVNGVWMTRDQAILCTEGDYDFCPWNLKK